jgi:hypothetical protein
MVIAAQLYQGGREAERHRVEFDATLRDPASLPLDVVIEDLSTGGFRVVTDTDLPTDAEVGLGLAGIGTHRARVVWRGDGIYGCEFVTALKEDDLRTALDAPSSDPVALPSPSPKDTASWADAAQEEPERLSLLARTFTIGAAAIAAWVLAIALGWFVFRAVVALLPH